MNAIDSYIAELADQLHTGRRKKNRILEEIREHLIDASFHAQAAGGADADSIAIDAFGSAKQIACDANAHAGARATRRTPGVILIAGLSLVAALIFAARNQPATTENPWVSTQITFFIGMLAMQLAVVAGICATSRAAAFWQTAASHGSQRAMIHQCAMISSTALTVAAFSFTTTLTLVRMRATNIFSLALAGCTMLIVAVGLLITTHTTRVNPSEEADVPHTAPIRILGAGESALDIVRNHPASACTVVAVLAGWTAMSHAETTIVGSLPWVITEITAVVLLFATLGPTLGLRNRRQQTLR